ncbi:uncharacterized protein LOC122013857 [Zingiber officinale]|uniref:uncharacterized protein LOC122013857 n=1 Tax=Zingiber officinale TaxID=94328 RepID=UPI001C4C23F4|nr:uncharacterized protein LOC122013857 [Zingiber officinale]
MAPRNWASGLPSELLSQIFELCNYFHRARFAAVCRPWHTAKLQTSKLLSTPWLMLSLPFDYRRWLAASSSADLDPMARLRLPDINGLAAIGSSPDGWLVFVDMENEILVLNPLNKVSIQFPSFKTYPEATPLHIIPAFHNQRHIEARPDFPNPNKLLSFRVFKVVLSPSSSPGSSAAAVIYQSMGLLMISLSDGWVPVDLGYIIRDVIFHNAML